MLFRSYQPEAYVPSSDTYIEKDAQVNDHIEQMRLSATKALLERQDCLVVSTVSSIYGLGDPESYFKMVMHLSRGEIIDQRGILRQLAELQYMRNDIDFKRGTYRVRGDVIDIFPAESDELAIRVELFDEEIENICTFDPLTGAIEESKQAGVVSPLAEFKFSKKDIRDISRALGFPWWDKPAQPCLSSRFPYGHEITSERLKMVEKAEEYLKEGGISEVRVRCQGSTARIEIPKDELKHFFNKYNFSELVQYFSNLGFKCTSLDLEGLISGKLNK